MICVSCSRRITCAKVHGLFYLNYPQINEVGKSGHVVDLNDGFQFDIFELSQFFEARYCFQLSSGAEKLFYFVKNCASMKQIYITKIIPKGIVVVVLSCHHACPLLDLSIEKYGG